MPEDPGLTLGETLAVFLHVVWHLALMAALGLAPFAVLWWLIHILAGAS